MYYNGQAPCGISSCYVGVSYFSRLEGKKMKVILKVLKYLFLILFSLILILYISLNIYVKSKEVKVNKSELLRSSTVSLSDEQIKIASIVLNEDSNPKFHNYIFLINDAFSKRNFVALLTALDYIDEYEDIRKFNSNELRIMELATKRYIMKKIDYKTCYNYLFSKSYFGNNIFGLSDASDFYYGDGEIALLEGALHRNAIHGDRVTGLHPVCESVQIGRDGLAADPAGCR